MNDTEAKSKLEELLKFSKETEWIEFKSLKSRKLIEGRRPNLFVSAKIAAATDKKALYIKQKAFNKVHYEKMIISYLEKFGEATRKEIEELLIDKISDVLDPKQKKHKINNLLQGMRKRKKIYSTASNRWAKWYLCK